MRTTLLSSSAIFLLIACGSSPCPPGSRRAGSSCTFPTHPDAGTEADDAGEQCLADQDGDGFGVAGIYAACGGADVQPGDCDDTNASAFPGAPVDRCDQADNDCDGKDEPPAAEVCNGLDDDCKDGIDNGVANACGQCGELPAEICNGVDDDCDGATDPGMVEKFAAGGEHVFTQAALPARPFLAGQVGLVPRKDGGAWLLYRGLADVNKEATSIEIVQLAKNGALAATLASKEETEGTSLFVVATDARQEWVAVALRQRRASEGSISDNSAWLRVLLFDAADMRLVDQYAIVSKEDDDSGFDGDDADDCDDAWPLDVAVQSDAAGDVHVAVVYRDTQGVSSGSGCSTLDRTFMRVARYSKADGWSLQQAPYKLADVALPRPLAHVEAVPCRDEWLLVHGDAISAPINWSARLSTIDGQVGATDLDTFEDVDFVPAIVSEHVECERDAATTLVAYGKQKDDQYSTHVRRWSTNLKTGQMSRVGSDIEVLPDDAVINGTALEAGGRWFLAGWTVQTGRAVLREISLSESAVEPSRSLPLFGEGGDGANPGNTTYEAILLGAQAALAPTGQGLIAAFPNAFGDLSTLNSYRENGSTDPVVAVTYAIGCR